jgi:hypothetical protein
LVQKKAEFSETIKMIEETLEARIGRGALMSKLNATTSIFVLKNKYGYTDKLENRHIDVSLEDIIARMSELPDVN